MFRLGMATWLILITASTATANLTKIDRTLTKQPTYQGTPGYLLLAFGKKSQDRVWLVRDGKTLYVDRNGDGDLTGADEKIAATVIKKWDPAKYGYSFDIGELHVGGKVHKAVSIRCVPLQLYADDANFKSYRPLHQLLKANPRAAGVAVWADVQSDTLRGGGLGGRLAMSAGFYDGQGVLQFASTPAKAPVVHFDGPLQVTFYGQKPKLILDRSTELILTVGTQGLGPGTFAMLAYQDAIPDTCHPRTVIRWPSASARKRIQTEHTLKKRC